jgi:hypothetical protein
MRGSHWTRGPLWLPKVFKSVAAHGGAMTGGLGFVHRYPTVTQGRDG